MNKIIFACGLHSLLFALFHMGFWKIFNWKEELKSSTVSVRAILQIANLRLIHVLLVTAAVCFLFPDELIATSFGRFYLGGMSLFWMGRLVEQFIFLRYNKLILHVLSALFVVGAVLFALPLFIP